MTGSEGTMTCSGDGAAATRAMDLDLLPLVTGSPKNLPNEVLLNIFTPLEKKHLKAVRCVCRLFSRLVSPLLFDQIFISPHKPNLDVFRQITEHRDLCQYPRTLIYDVQEFIVNIDTQIYFKKLCHQLSCFLYGYPKADIRHVDKELEGLLHMLKSCTNPAKHNPEYKKYSTCRIVQRGLELYSEKAEEQDHYNNGELLASLCIGLIRLTHVDKVRFQSNWTDRHLRPIDWSKNPRDLRLSSSPLARTWSPFHLLPTSSIHDIPLTSVFDNVIRAFSLTGRPLRALDAMSSRSVAYEVFNLKSLFSRTFRQHSFPALLYLESLSLAIEMNHHSMETLEEGPKEKTLSVELLAAALRHIPGLRSLRLNGRINDSGNGLISIRELLQILPLPALEDLDLNGLLGSAAHISAFLRAQPRLRKLGLRTVELSEGTWVGLVDDMRRWLVLDSLDLQLPLREDGGVDLWDGESWVDLEMSEQIEEYVLNGGENPLRPDDHCGEGVLKTILGPSS